MLKSEKNQGISCYRGIMLLVLVGALFVVSAPNQSYAAAQGTVATFADPSSGEDDPLFKVIFSSLAGPGSLRGGWGDDQTGLYLEIVWPCAATDVYENAFFIMPEIVYYGDASGTTGAGVIKFYEDGDTAMTEALLKLEFGSAHVSTGGVYANSIFVDNVRISGAEIPVLDMESFSFSFGSVEPVGGDWGSATGFTATAAFTSSAVVPEPISLGLLTLGSLVLLRAGRRSGARR
ncbi:MAG: hypothetical protein KAJ46_08580 [Sedimentisphaerales bacterium]|nr:hypothetical protein [Sedimentisphaerales bacterium]